MYDDQTSLELATAPSLPASTSRSVYGPASCQQGDLDQRQEQFAALATSVAGALYTTALRWSGDHARAEDLVQETHLCAWRNFDRFTVGSCFSAWVFQILRFLAWNKRRSASTRQITMDFLTDESLSVPRFPEEKSIAPFETDWESVFPDLVDDRLKHALDCLTPDQRTLALCIPLGGLSYQECADQLGIPVGTVMSRYWRARTRLRKALRRSEVDGRRCRASRSG